MALKRGKPFVFANERAHSEIKRLRTNDRNDEKNGRTKEPLLLRQRLFQYPYLIIYIFIKPSIVQTNSDSNKIFKFKINFLKTFYYEFIDEADSIIFSNKFPFYELYSKQ